MALYNPHPPLPLEEHIRLLRLLVAGKTQDQIALEFGLSRETIKARCKKMREYIGVETLYQAIAVGVSRGWVEAPKVNK